MAANIKTRVFIVGCPRSGTTLLQSMLYANPEIYSFPETHFFKILFSVGEQLTLRRKPRGLVQWLRFVKRDVAGRLEIVDYRRGAKAWKNMRFLPDEDLATVGKSISLKYNAEAFVRLVDAASLRAGRRMWVEKTPDHVFCVKRIQQYIPDAKFIHIIRNGPDTVASLVDAGRKYPEQWGREPATLVEHSIRRWNNTARESYKYREDLRHCFVRYEELVSDPAKILSGLCGFLGCDFDEKMLTEHSEKVSSLILGNKPWQAATAGPIRRDTADSKFRAIFNSELQDYILRHLETLYVYAIALMETLDGYSIQIDNIDLLIV